MNIKILKRPYFLLSLVICIALIVRLTNLKDNFLFAYDQARDAQRIYNMVYKGNLKIVGPETDIQGVFNGPLFYYALAPVYYIAHFDPNAAALFMVLINVGTILLVYWSAKLIFNKNSIALVGSLFWALSFEQGFFARYISNASPMSTTTTLFFIGLALFFLKKKQWGLPLSAAGIALAIHCNFYFIYLFLFYPLFFIIFKQKRPQAKTILWTIIGLVVLLSPWIVTELKWKFVGTRSLFAYFLNQGGSISSQSHPLSFIASMFTHFYDRVSEALFFSFIPNKTVAFALILFVMVYLLVKKRTSSSIFILLWILNTLPLFVFNSGVLSTQVINGSIFVPLTILVAYGCIELSRFKVNILPIISIICIIFITLYGLSCYIKNNFLTHSVHIGIPTLLINSKQIIDYTYQKSNKKDFGICSISEPLFMNTVWSFLYSTYGKSKYGYLPYWTGQQQTLNESFIPYAKKKYETKFIIQEPMSGIPQWALRSVYFVEDSQNTLVESKSFGYYSVQQRHFIKENGGSIDAYSESLKKSIYEDLGKLPQLSCDNLYK